jgi:hypothetical protein
MEEDVINAQDLVNPETPQEQEVVQEQQVQEAKPIEAPKKQEQPESAPQKSFRMMREEKERIEKERDDMRRKLEALEQSRQQTQPQQEPQDEDFNFNPDDLVEGKHLSKVAKKIKNLERQLEEYQQRSSLATTETRLKAEYPDFDKVVSKDNIEVLKLTYPELAQSIDSNPDLYVKAKSAYTLIKKLGIEQDLNNYEQENERANKNLAKPKPAVNTQQGDSPLSMANAFAGGATKEARMKIYRQAQEYASKKGFQ